MNERVVRVLAVDDDAALLGVVSRVLSLAGYRCIQATSGVEALNLMASQSMDAVLTDLTMPGMDGIEFMRKARARDPDLPILVFTGAPGIESAVQSIDSGVFKYITKPAEPTEIVRAIGDAVHARALALARRAAYDHVEAPQRIAPTADLLLRALDTMWLAVQPIVDPENRRVVAFEALLRTKDPVLRDPGSLLVAAERLEMHSAVGRRVRHHATEIVQRLPADVDLFVNLHPRDLLDGELFSASAPLSKCSGRVVLEMTERSSLEAIPDARSRVAQLKVMGYRVALDDMGAGYAGLTSFAMLKPTIVKIDLSLVRDVDSDSMKQTLIRTIVNLAGELDMQVIAECVETPAERACLTSLGCSLLQGYLFARPDVPFPEVAW